MGTKYGEPKVDIDPPQVQGLAKDIIVHPRFNETGKIGHDVAIVVLEDAVTYTEQVKPICLPETNQDFPVTSLCYLTGWGVIDNFDGR